MKKLNGISRQFSVGSRQSAESSRQIAVSNQQSTICKPQTIYYSLPTVYCLLLSALCFLNIGCFQPESACLDIEATNFDITADEPCGDDDSANGCPCTYPIFSFRTDYLFDKVAYTDGGRYQVDGQLIQIDDIQLYLSNFAFRYTSGEWTQVTDTIGVAIQNEAGLKDTILTDDFVLINQQSSFDVGAIQRSGTFDSLRFLVGIMHPANTVNPDSVSRSRHPLTETEMHTGDVGTGYIFSRFVFRKDTLENTVATTLTVSQHIGSGKIVPIQMPISTKSSIESKFFVGTLTINHAKWFDGIKFVTDSDEAMIEKLVANTPTVFSIVN